jgi:hypothetical protein
MTEIYVNPYLTWEYSDDPAIQYLNCPAPTPIRNHMPEWFKTQKARKAEIDIADHQTVRNCLGFRGLATVGYTIPLPEPITCYDTYFNRGRLHPEMLHGTRFANRSTDGKPWAPGDGSPYEYGVRLLHWPWRARMAPGWRMLILPYLLDWPSNWNEFAGMVEPNYNIENGTSVGSALQWTQTVDPTYNYYNLETVIAFKRHTIIDKDTVTFCAVPLFDPELEEKQRGMV